jgi:hypothetical protein
MSMSDKWCNSCLSRRHAYPQQTPRVSFYGLLPISHRPIACGPLFHPAVSVCWAHGALTACLHSHRTSGANATSPFLLARRCKVSSLHQQPHPHVLLPRSHTRVASKRAHLSTERDLTTWRTADADAGVEDEDEELEVEAGETTVVVGRDAAAEERMEAVTSVMSSGILGFVTRRTVPTHTNKMASARGSLSQRNNNKLAVTTTTSRSTLVALTRPRIRTS